ncbi:MAG: hypothetical protein A3D13_04700 [Planctomycetes bacterium RIFCSPHIGHO2_02_FULL_40_12]|nr:MAG: hypothetical protein A3D13_04700 [Planctomycetes bacterium RIFCSPHIGHO2_02_FULL_40_12]
MLKYSIIFIFILWFIQTHTLCATEANNTIKGIEDKETTESENGKWTGIDVSIVGKYAGKYGHPPRDPYINTDQGDLLLFVFTVAGLIGGIIIGYNFRKLFVEGKDQGLHRKDAKIAKTK